MSLAGSSVGAGNSTVYFIASDLEWEPGRVIDNETFAASPHKTFFTDRIPSDLRGVDDYEARREAEQTVESCRIRSFPDKPSRSRAIFLNLTPDDAKRWTLKRSRANFHIYELAVMRSDAVAEANYIWFNYLVRLFTGRERELRNVIANDLDGEVAGAARAYWDNASTEPFGEASRTEVLLLGSLRVVRRLPEA